MPDFPALYTPLVSLHAIERYQQRIAPTDAATAKAHMLCPFIAYWVSRGAHAVRGHAGLTVYAKGGVVMTVIPADWKPTRNGGGRRFRGRADA